MQFPFRLHVYENVYTGFEVLFDFNCINKLLLFRLGTFNAQKHLKIACKYLSGFIHQFCQQHNDRVIQTMPLLTQFSRINVIYCTP